MPPVSGFVYGLLTAFFWALADFVAKRSVDEADPIAVTLGMQVTGGLIMAFIYGGMLLVAPEQATFWSPTPGGNTPLWGAVNFGIGWVAITGVVLAYRSYSLAPLSVASPLVNTKGMFGALFAVVLLSESVDAFTVGGALCCTAGAMVMGHKSEGEATRFLRPGAGTALVAGAFYGLAMTLTKLPVDGSGPGFSIWMVRGGAFFILLPYAIWKLGARNALPAGNLWSRIWLIGFLDALGHLCIVLGLSKARAFIVVSLATLAPIITVLLALFFLGERLTRRQWAALGAVMGGLWLLAGSSAS